MKIKIFVTSLAFFSYQSQATFTREYLCGKEGSPEYLMAECNQSIVAPNGEAFKLVRHIRDTTEDVYGKRVEEFKDYYETATKTFWPAAINNRSSHCMLATPLWVNHIEKNALEIFQKALGNKETDQNLLLKVTFPFERDAFFVGSATREGKVWFWPDTGKFQIVPEDYGHIYAMNTCVGTWAYDNLVPRGALCGNTGTIKERIENCGQTADPISSDPTVALVARQIEKGIVKEYVLDKQKSLIWGPPVDELGSCGDFQAIRVCEENTDLGIKWRISKGRDVADAFGNKNDPTHLPKNAKFKEILSDVKNRLFKMSQTAVAGAFDPESGTTVIGYCASVRCVSDFQELKQ